MKKLWWILSCCAVMPLVSSCHEAEQRETLDVVVVCGVGTTRCDGNAVMQCQVDHTWAIQTDCLAMGQVCRVGAQGAECRDKESVAPVDPGETCGECSSGEVCVDGACVQNSCADGLMLCSTVSGNICIDINGDDENNCGGCGYVCSAHPQAHATSNICVNGRCEYTCDEPYTNIGTATEPNCTDLETDVKNCGAKDNTCGDGEVCVNGMCAKNSCADGLMLCSTVSGNICIDINGDNENNCGACGYKCSEHPQANATSNICVNGRCEYTCDEPYTNIGSAMQPHCVDLQSDIKNCGSAGNDCTKIANADVTYCNKGTCAIAVCQSGYYNSDNTCIPTDDQHCGGNGSMDCTANKQSKQQLCYKANESSDGMCVECWQNDHCSKSTVGRVCDLVEGSSKQYQCVRCATDDDCILTRCIDHVCNYPI